jgi:hypothetical protein
LIFDQELIRGGTSEEKEFDKVKESGFSKIMRIAFLILRMPDITVNNIELPHYGS